MKNRNSIFNKLIPEKDNYGNNETSEYDIVYWDSESGNKVECGTGIIDIKNQDSTLLVNLNLNIDTKLITFSNLKERGLQIDNVEYSINKKTLKAEYSKHSISNAQYEIESLAKYKKKKVEIKTISSITGIQKLNLSFSNDVLDNYQLHTTLRHLDFENFESSEFNLVIPHCGLNLEVTLKLLNIENINTPIGDFECYRLLVHSIFPIEQKIYFHISVKKPHYLIKYSSGPSTLIIKSIINN